MPTGNSKRITIDPDAPQYELEKEWDAGTIDSHTFYNGSRSSLGSDINLSRIEGDEGKFTSMKDTNYDRNNTHYKQMQQELEGVAVGSEDKEGKELRKLMRSYGIFREQDLKYNTKCYRYPITDPYNFVDGAKEYVFITKVDLPILNDEGNMLSDETRIFPYILELWRSGYKMSVFANLCSSISENSLEPDSEKKYPFMRILSNRKTSNLDLPDINAEELEGPVNLFGSKIIYSKSSALSDENIDFSLEFEDTKFLEIYNLFKVYDLYRQGKWLGIFGPGVHVAEMIENNKMNGLFATYLKYAVNKILYDHMTVFKFLVASDGTTILHAAKLTGCFPKTISRSSLSELDEKGGLKITVGFKMSGWLEEDIFEIARDFNAIIYEYAGGRFLYENVAEPIYDTEIDRVSQDLVDYPFIRRYRPSGQTIRNFSTYKLLWGNI